MSETMEKTKDQRKQIAILGGGGLSVNEITIIRVHIFPNLFTRFVNTFRKEIVPITYPEERGGI